MKALITLLFTVALVVNLSSCYTGRPVATKSSDNNNTYTVSYLFEHDGCKVYRFYDRGNYVYFTNCNGNVTAIANDSTATRIENSVKVYPR